MEIKNPKASFQYTDSFGNTKTMNISLYSDEVFELVNQFKHFLLATEFHPDCVEEAFFECISDDFLKNIDTEPYESFESEPE